MTPTDCEEFYKAHPEAFRIMCEDADALSITRYGEGQYLPTAEEIDMETEA